jgi:hypothetical protein
MTMRKVREFTDPTDARTARQLTRQVAELEDNAANETAEIRNGFQQKLKPKTLNTAASGVVVAPGQSIGVDTSGGDIEVLLEEPSPKYEGLFIVISKRSALNTITVRANGGALIDGASSVAVTALGLKLLFCDGVEYWG